MALSVCLDNHSGRNLRWHLYIMFHQLCIKIVFISGKQFVKRKAGRHPICIYRWSLHKTHSIYVQLVFPCSQGHEKAILHQFISPYTAVKQFSCFVLVSFNVHFSSYEEVPPLIPPPSPMTDLPMTWDDSIILETAVTLRQVWEDTDGSSFQQLIKHLGLLTGVREPLRVREVRKETWMRENLEHENDDTGALSPGGYRMSVPSRLPLHKQGDGRGGGRMGSNTLSDVMIFAQIHHWNMTFLQKAPSHRIQTEGHLLCWGVGGKSCQTVHWPFIYPAIFEKCKYLSVALTGSLSFLWVIVAQKIESKNRVGKE